MCCLVCLDKIQSSISENRLNPGETVAYINTKKLLEMTRLSCQSHNEVDFIVLCQYFTGLLCNGQTQSSASLRGTKETEAWLNKFTMHLHLYSLI